LLPLGVTLVAELEDETVTLLTLAVSFLFLLLTIRADATI
jgi:hypothetical protein